MSTKSLLILPGDGIGPEVMDEVIRVIDWFKAKRGMEFEVETDLVGGAAYDVHGTPAVRRDDGQGTGSRCGAAGCRRPGRNTMIWISV